MKLEIQEMTLSDLMQIQETLARDFDDFWTVSLLKAELENPNSMYVVAKDSTEIVGFRRNMDLGR